MTGSNVCQSDGTLCGLFKQCGNQVCREIYTYMITKLFVALLNIYFKFGYDMLHLLLSWYFSFFNHKLISRACLQFWNSCAIICFVKPSLNFSNYIFSPKQLKDWLTVWLYALSVTYCCLRQKLQTCKCKIKHMHRAGHSRHLQINQRTCTVTILQSNNYYPAHKDDRVLLINL